MSRRLLVGLLTLLPTPDASGRIAHVARIPIEKLATGRYTLRLIVQQGDKREIREASFTLVD
jgi:hypothetical protein